MSGPVVPQTPPAWQRLAARGLELKTGARLHPLGSAGAACELKPGGASVAAPGQGLEGASSSRGPAPHVEGREPGRPGAPVVVTRVAPPHC